MSTHTVRYSQPAIWLHWVMAVLMIFVLFWGERLIRVPHGTSLAEWKPSAHASLGILILLLSLARLLWRLGTPPPALPPAMSRWQVAASHAIHRAFYVLMMPSRSRDSLPSCLMVRSMPTWIVTLFTLLPAAFLPDLGGWTGNAHAILSYLAKARVIVHVLTAVKHQCWDQDGLLRRMRPLWSSRIRSAVLTR